MRQDAEREGKVVPFHEIVANTSPLACSDPRDIVFALTSLCPNCGLQPDYNLSTAAVYTAFSRQLIRHGMFEMLLQNLQADRQLQRNHRLGLSWIVTKPTLATDSDLEDLPTWALDLRKGFRLFAPIEPSSSPSKFPTGHPSDVRFNRKDDSITCCVYFIGTIAKSTKDSFRLIETVVNGEYNRAEARVKVEFPDAPLAGKGDILVAFDQSKSTRYSYYNVMLLRKMKDRDAYALLHWRYRASVEFVDSFLSPPTVQEKRFVRIV
ncbi:hypothetical protein M409DRAFT_51142 [Zasmidium cellare ATCC 36951]|uniref:Heterokaryon incompatibility domain-containing protein n=1 Tax=Zasmidium cellare ATCC 36951 TaxID=1080233 RepID=A0A6A6CZU1_ZASCE|nr:uncharacterized protein M409DRAFT_51142 [Zasmidium cellare ATCC 36951]KAF2170896.1 hypothetical protein M409DRAFT_51142 [Zasmidium cellare ATCC 36951]